MTGRNPAFRLGPLSHGPCSPEGHPTYMAMNTTRGPPPYTIWTIEDGCWNEDGWDVPTVRSMVVIVFSYVKGHNVAIICILTRRHLNMLMEMSRSGHLGAGPWPLKTQAPWPLFSGGPPHVYSNECHWRATPHTITMNN